MLSIGAMEERPIDKIQAYSSGVMTVLHLVVYYGVAIGIWGLALKKSFLWFTLVGVIIGLLLGLIAGPIIAKQRTNERSREMMFAVGAL